MKTKYEARNYPAISNFRCFLVIMSILMLMLLVKIPLSLAQVASTGNSTSSKTQVFPLDSRPYGLTYGEWSAKWWQWARSLSTAETSPTNDRTGENCAQKQSGPVWFLAGTTGGAVERKCTVPQGKAILFPIVNGEASYVENPLVKTESELVALDKSVLDQVTVVEATVDGVKLQDLDKYRVQSELFNLTFPENNLEGVPAGPTQAVADGYWVILHPLPIGEHTIHFSGAVGSPTTTGAINFVTDVTYHLTIPANATTASTTKTSAAQNATTNATTTNATTAQQQQSPLMLEGTSSSAKFKAQINWTSNDIGKDNLFDVKFFDSATGSEISNSTYTIMLFKGQEHLSDTHREGQIASRQAYTFDEVGSYTLRIENINGSGREDGIDIPIQVTPEFPSLVVTPFALAAALFGVIIFATRIIIREKSFLMS